RRCRRWIIDSLLIPIIPLHPGDLRPFVTRNLVVNCSRGVPGICDCCKCRFDLDPGRAWTGRSFWLHGLARLTGLTVLVGSRMGIASPLGYWSPLFRNWTL